MRGGSQRIKKKTGKKVSRKCFQFNVQTYKNINKFKMKQDMKKKKKNEELPVLENYYSFSGFQ